MNIKRLIIVVFTLVSLLGGARAVFCEDLTMDELRQRYKKEFNKDWDQIEKIERKEFIQELRRVDREKLYRERKVMMSNKATERARTTGELFAIRHRFLVEKGEYWYNASLEEQKEFITQYKKDKQKKEKIAKRKHKIEDKKHRNYVKDNNNKEKQRLRRKRAREKKRAAVSKAKQRKRKAARKRVSNMKKKFARERKRMNRRRR